MSFHKLSSKYYEAVGRLTCISREWAVHTDVQKLLDAIDSLLNIHATQPNHRYHISGNRMEKLCLQLSRILADLEEGVPDDEFDTWLISQWLVLGRSVAVNVHGELTPFNQLYDFDFIWDQLRDQGMTLRSHFPAWLVSRWREIGAIGQGQTN